MEMPLHILITAGPTVEDLDPVRFISNRATGLLGTLASRAALQCKHRVILIHGPLSSEAQREATLAARKKGFTAIPVRSAVQMHGAVRKNLARTDVVIMTAAVADFTPVRISMTKLKKAKTGLSLRLKPTVDILAELGKLKKSKFKKLKLIGFALETGSGQTAKEREQSRFSEAQRKLLRKNLDAIVLDTPAAMGANEAAFTIIFPNNGILQFNGSKRAFAKRLIKLAEWIAFRP